MAYPDLNSLPADFRQRATGIRLACFDVDGTLTDGRLYLDSEGREQKAFHVLDGQGLVLLRRAGLQVALITARHSPIAHLRARELDIPAFDGVRDKLAKVNELAEMHGLGLDEVAFMGDDLPDQPPMAAVGLAAKPATAHPLMRAHWQSTLPAGEGAVREFCDLLLAVQGKLEAFHEGVRA